MTVKENKEDKTAEYEIHKLKTAKGTTEAVFSGMCALRGWKKGKMVSEAEYEKAAEDFMGSPIDQKGK